MKRATPPLLALVLGLGLLLPTAARAVLMRVDFTVLADPTDPVRAGQTASGYFTYDSSIAPTGGGILEDDVNGLGASDLSFTWDGHTWTRADADMYVMGFDAGGNLNEWFIGGAVQGYSGVSDAFYPDFFLDTFGAFPYATATNGGTTYTGSLQSYTVGPASAAAQPGTLALWGAGLLPLGVVLRRRRRA